MKIADNIGLGNLGKAPETSTFPRINLNSNTPAASGSASQTNADQTNGGQAFADLRSVVSDTADLIGDIAQALKTARNGTPADIAKSIDKLEDKVSELKDKITNIEAKGGNIPDALKQAVRALEDQIEQLKSAFAGQKDAAAQAGPAEQSSGGPEAAGKPEGGEQAEGGQKPGGAEGGEESGQPQGAGGVSASNAGGIGGLSDLIEELMAALESGDPQKIKAALGKLRKGIKALKEQVEGEMGDKLDKVGKNIDKLANALEGGNQEKIAMAKADLKDSLQDFQETAAKAEGNGGSPAIEALEEIQRQLDAVVASGLL